jgi:O-acetyl-ADP-ribose deacetylase (regulator of RNase III)
MNPPSEIAYVVGDATAPAADGEDGVSVIAHICNDVGGWGKGFVGAISRRWPGPEQHYRSWYDQRIGYSRNGRFSDYFEKHKQHVRAELCCGPFGLGAIQVVPVARNVFVCNMVAQKGIGAERAEQPPIRYEALKRCLDALCGVAVREHARVHMPRIGCGLAGGEWPKVESLVKESLCSRGVPVVVYDYQG